jgi:hypothetical protein
MPLIRGLDQLIEDLDDRARPDPPSKNRVLTKFKLISDVVALSSETTITTLATPPYHWHDAAGTTATSLIWGLGEWHA